ncbi:hypothetical protein GmHk_20G057697 [Glycine max]|nr:hypothetical protein GmHk_20G057697 [Glycine max]
MVRTRGLSHALGQVTGRGVGRGDRDDSDDAPQRRRPTASARRQRVAVTADHIDESVIPVPDVQDDLMEALAAVEDIPADDAVQMLVDLLMVSPESARAETVQCRGPYVRLQWSATNVHVVYLEALRDLSMTERYAWGVAALVHMYDQLNDASMSHSRQLGGYITLLQVRDFHVRSCYSGLLRWGPVAVYYRPERVVRQFGYTQTIPAPPVDSWVSYDDIHDRWMHYEDHIVPVGEVCIVPGACSSDYIDWFFRISHPFMTPGHALDPLPHGHAPQPRVVPQAPQTDIPRVPEPEASSTSAEEPRHAVVKVCDDIAERLERHLSLGVVTPGSSTHEVIEECLRLARSVIHDHLVYVRCRRRRRTDQA